MYDLISRRAAIDIIRAERDKSITPKEWHDGMNMAIFCLIYLSPVQPDIIRCKDCMWRNEDNACENMYDRYGFWPEVEPNGFCSWAERREDDRSD